MKTIAVTIDEDLLVRLDRLADGNRSLVVREAVAQYLTRQERDAADARDLEIYRRNRRRLAREAAALIRAQAKL